MDWLLSAPAYEVRQLAESIVYLQLSPDVDDTMTHYEQVDAVREKVQKHLGRDAFFEARRAYPTRTPRGPLTLASLREFKTLEPGHNGFRVPDFQLIPD